MTEPSAGAAGESGETHEAAAGEAKRPAWKRWLKRIGLGVAGFVVIGGSGGGIYACTQASAYDASVAKVYDIPVPTITRSSDPAVIARGKHLTQSLTGCAGADCHGADFGGGKPTDAGPIGVMIAPNITTILPAYSDGEIARLIRHGVKKDGRAARFMPVNEFNWISDSDVVALVSYLRTVPQVDRPSGTMTIKTLGKILDRKDLIPIDVTRRIDHGNIELAPPPSPTAAYGKFIGRLCSGCHGTTFGGGPIPGTPPDFPVPLNLTPHETGLKGWTFEDFETLAKTGVRKNGQKLASFMPIEEIEHMDDVEKRALWAYLETLPAVPFGSR